MSTQPQAEEAAVAAPAGPPERRDDPRLPVDEQAQFIVASQGLRIACRVIEVSLNGCRLQGAAGFPSTPSLRGEVSFSLRGIAFRFSSILEWAAGNAAGIRFVDVSARRREEFVEVLCELAARIAIQSVKRAAESLAAEESALKSAAEKGAAQKTSNPALPATPAPAAVPRPAKPTYVQTPAQPPKPDPASPRATQPVAAQPAAPAAASQPKPAGHERRTQSRQEVDTSATILLVNIASRLPGRILNLSIGGCRIRTDDRFPVGIYTRVETEFHLEGLPFRLGGVVQAIQDRHNIGIRFLDMSERKREQVEQLIAEIAEQDAQHSA